MVHMFIYFKSQTITPTWYMNTFFHKKVLRGIGYALCYTFCIGLYSLSFLAQAQQDEYGKGFVPPSSSENIRLQQKLLSWVTTSQATSNTKHKAQFGSPSQSHLDLRELGYCTPPSRQGKCGSCWAFSALACFESNYLMLNGGDPNTLNLSEQYVLDCASIGSCGGGYAQAVFDWLLEGNRLAEEVDFPYTAQNQACRATAPRTPYRAARWDYVSPTRSWWIIPSQYEIKKALCEHGAISTIVYAGTLFEQYRGGIFKENNNSQPNHAVTIVGWDDGKGAWLIKNSWGTWWGEKGYMWLDYDSNKVGMNAVWVEAQANEEQANIPKPNPQPDKDRDKTTDTNTDKDGDNSRANSGNVVTPKVKPKSKPIPSPSPRPASAGVRVRVKDLLGKGQLAEKVLMEINGTQREITLNTQSGKTQGYAEWDLPGEGWYEYRILNCTTTYDLWITTYSLTATGSGRIYATKDKVFIISGDNSNVRLRETNSP